MMEIYFLINVRNYNIKEGEVFSENPNNILGKIELCDSISRVNHSYLDGYDVYMVENLDEDLFDYGLGMFGSNSIKVLKKLSTDNLIDLDMDGYYSSSVIKYGSKSDKLTNVEIRALKKIVDLNIGLYEIVNISLYNNNIANVDFVDEYIEKQIVDCSDEEMLRALYNNIKSKKLKELIRDKVILLTDECVDEYLNDYDPYEYFY